MLTESPLAASHRELGAKMVPFGGWEMPLSYQNGTVHEHRACRTGAVVFDVSHLGTVRVAGAGAFDALQRTLSNDLSKIGPGRAQYTHLLDPEDASVVDDIIVWWRPDGAFDVMPNASNTDRVTRALAELDDDRRIDVANTTPTRAILAVQGPDARSRLASVHAALASVKRFGVAETSWRGSDVAVAGTGYTGEDGVEIAVPAERAPELWSALLAAGIEPAGLGARDTLRLEAGLPLHGHELGPGITPLQARLGWVVAWNKGPFRGRDPLLRERDAGVTRTLRGLVVEGRRPPRADQAVLRDEKPIGVITSGNFSPMLEVGIALAFLPPDSADGDRVDIDVRGSLLPAVVTDPPFYRRAT